MYLYPLNKYFNTKKRIFLSGSTFEEQYTFKNGLNQLYFILSISNDTSNNFFMKDITCIVYKQTMIGIIFETSKELYLITPILSSLLSQFKFIELIISLNLKKIKSKCFHVIDINEFIYLLILTFSINNYNIYKKLITKNYISLTYSKDRIKKVVITINKIKSILNKKYNINSNCKSLEICCGYGLSTIGLKLNQIEPLCIDNNKEDLSLGFYIKFLDPKKTICLDIQNLSYFISKNYFDICFGFMIGSIYNFNKNIWKNILFESLKSLKKNGLLILTVRTNDEINIINKWLINSIKNPKIIDNRDNKTEYDQWIYFGFKK